MAEVDLGAIGYVSAVQGYEVLVHLPDDKTYEAQPVVAWAVLPGEENFVAAHPVTLQPWLVTDDRPVRLPSGEVICGDMQWANADEWLADMEAGLQMPAWAKKQADNAPILALDTFRNKFQGQ